MAYRGFQARIICGAGGLNANDNAFRVPVTDLVRAVNITFDGDAWRKAPGSTAFDTTAVAGSPTPILRDGTDWHPDNATQRIVTFWDSGAVYKEVSGNVDSVTLVSGLVGTGPSMFVEGGAWNAATSRKLFLFSKGNPVNVLTGDGATMSTITSPPTDWSGTNQPVGGGILGGRLYGFGNLNWPHAIYFSGIDAHEDFVTGSPPIPSVFPGEGERIAAVIPFVAAPEETRLYIFKYPFGLYYMDISDPTTILTYKVRDDIGMSSARAWARAGNDVIFMSSTGSIHSLTAVQSSEDIRDSDLSAMTNLDGWLDDNLDTTRLDFVNMTFDEYRKELHIGIPGIDDGVDDDADGDIDRKCCGTKIFVDMSGAMPRIATDDKELHYEAMFLYRETDSSYSVYGGGAGGKVYKFGRSNRTVDGAAYAGLFETPTTDFGWADPELASAEKRFDWLEVNVMPTGNYDLAFDVYIDGLFSETVTINLGQAGGIFGSFVIGTDKLGGNNAVGRKCRLHGKGRRLALVGYNSGADQDFSVSEIIVHMRTERVRKGAE